MFPPRASETDTAVSSSPHLMHTSTQTTQFLPSSKRPSRPVDSGLSSRFRADAVPAAVLVPRLSTHPTGGTGHVWLAPLMRFFSTGYVVFDLGCFGQCVNGSSRTSRYRSSSVLPISANPVVKPNCHLPSCSSRWHFASVLRHSSMQEMIWRPRLEDCRGDSISFSPRVTSGG